jgi:hypothetical protein
MQLLMNGIQNRCGDAHFVHQPVLRGSGFSASRLLREQIAVFTTAFLARCTPSIPSMVASENSNDGRQKDMLPAGAMVDCATPLSVAADMPYWSC